MNSFEAIGSIIGILALLAIIAKSVVEIESDKSDSCVECGRKLTMWDTKHLFCNNPVCPEEGNRV